MTLKLAKELSEDLQSMVDLNLWMSSPLMAFPHSEAHTQSKVAELSKPVRTSAEEDDSSDVSDDDGDNPLSGDPRLRLTTQPARRTKATAPKKTVSPTERKPDTSNVTFQMQHFCNVHVF
ncbi:hypothetical protein BDZ89DRAFT_553145 [Hymenopellis radicata]|nr:hypothetical protein BDZ89DRAFT_553145 [Hymenopellis radicata]